jgi:suppressor for copper-sensitivity B
MRWKTVVNFIASGVLLLLFPSNLAAITSSASPWVDRDIASIRLVSAAVATGDQKSVPMGLQVRLQKGWKIYWRSPGDAGFPPSLDWAGSDNLKAAEIQFPLPERFSILGFESFGYSDEVIYPIKVTLKNVGAPLTLRAKLVALVCSDICVPLDADLQLDLPAGPAAPSAEAQAINRAVAQVPADLPGSGLLITKIEAVGTPAHTIRVSLQADQRLVAPEIFPEGPPGVGFGAPEISLAADRHSAVFTLPAGAVDGQDLAAGRYTMTVADGDRFRVQTMLAKVAVALPTSPVMSGIVVILGFALLGGLILNLMPCVLPVLSMKLMTVANYGGAGSGVIRRGFLASAAGIICSFLLLALAALSMKLAGLSVGWGMQFQQPIFLLIMIVIIIGFAVNLWGWFDIPLPRFIADAGGRMMARDQGPTQAGIRGNFMTGMFATLLATPCSAPFLGTAIGFALARGPFEIVAVFGVMGIGLALPYLLIAAAPKLVSWLPKPGPWMVRFKKILSLALFATAVWLGSVMWTQAGFMVNSVSPTSAVKWQPFDPAALAGRVAAGQVVLVDVTADWCLTCKVNKALVLDQGAVNDVLTSGKIIGMRADWTNPDPEISAYLASFGRYGIPFNAVYGPGAVGGIALPELLSTDRVLAEIAAARNRK